MLYMFIKKYQEKLAYLITSMQKLENENDFSLLEQSNSSNAIEVSNTTNINSCDAKNNSILPLTCTLSVFE